MMLKALMTLINSGRWIGEAAWVKIIGMADEETLLWLRDCGLYEIKYFTREDWLGPTAADRMRVLINERLAELDGEDIISILKGLLL